MIKKLVLLSLFVALTGCSNKLPSCKSSEVEEVIKDIVNNKSFVGQFVNLNNIDQRGLNKEDQIRLCSGSLVTSTKTIAVFYSIKWQNKDQQQFIVELTAQ